MNTKILPVILIFLASFAVFGQESNSKEFVFVSTEPVGALLFAENCLGCHQISSFTASKPDDGYVKKLAEEIDYMIYAPSSAMSRLSFLKNSDLHKIARFLIYGSHIDGWVSEEYHGEVVEKQGSATCLKCHDNDRVSDIDVPSCSKCH